MKIFRIALGFSAATIGLGFAESSIPAERLFPEAWEHTGIQGSFASPVLQIEVKDFGAVGDGTTDDAPAVLAAIASLKGSPGVVFFAPGTYLLKQTIPVPSGVILRGKSPKTTVLRLTHSGPGIVLAGKLSGNFQPISKESPIRSRTLIIADPNHFSGGDFALVRQENDSSWNTSSWAAHVQGQMVRIERVEDDQLVLERPLRFATDLKRNPEICKVQPVIGAGVESIGLERMLAGTSRERDNIPTILLRYAAGCRIQNIESTMAFGSHIELSFSTQCEVRRNYLHHAHEYDGGGSGYGVKIQFLTGECLIVNNVFESLRHSLLFQAGANGNVVASNFSFAPRRTEFPSDVSADICFHGNYPFANLVEGNICQHIWFDNSHGANGPFNTVFRNRSESHGLSISDKLGSGQNLIGNELALSPWGRFIGGIESGLRGSGHFLLGNRFLDEPDEAMTHALPVSLYLTETKNNDTEWNPDVSGFPHPFPFIGPPVHPAKTAKEQR